MSDSEKRSMARLTRRSAADSNAIAQVEKWMAIIREISLEQAKT